MSITKILFSASNLLHKYNKIVTQKNQTDYLHEESLVIKLNGMKYDKTWAQLNLSGLLPT